MSFTGQLGTAASQPANIELGSGAAVSPPPPAPSDPQVHQGTVTALSQFGPSGSLRPIARFPLDQHAPPPPPPTDPQVHQPALSAISLFAPPGSVRPLFRFPLDNRAPPGQGPQVLGNLQVQMPAMPAYPLPGPWNPVPFVLARSNRPFRAWRGWQPLPPRSACRCSALRFRCRVRGTCSGCSARRPGRVVRAAPTCHPPVHRPRPHRVHPRPRPRPRHFPWVRLGGTCSVCPVRRRSPTTGRDRTSTSWPRF
jgi:hypothetical protein